MATGVFPSPPPPSLVFVSIAGRVQHSSCSSIPIDFLPTRYTLLFKGATSRKPAFWARQGLCWALFSLGTRRCVATRTMVGIFGIVNHLCRSSVSAQQHGCIGTCCAPYRTRLLVLLRTCGRQFVYNPLIMQRPRLLYYNCINISSIVVTLYRQFSPLKPPRGLMYKLLSHLGPIMYKLYRSSTDHLQIIPTW